MSNDSTMTSKKLVAQRFARSTPTYNCAAVVQRNMAAELVQRIERVVPTCRFAHVLELGCGTGLLTDWLVQRFTIDHLTLNDIIPVLTDVAMRCADRRPAMQIEILHGDMESIALPVDQDLIVSNAVLQWSTDPARMLGRMLSAVRPGGLLALSTFGPGNLIEIHYLTGNSLCYLSLESIAEQLAQQTDILQSDQRTRTLTFGTAFEVLQHLKRTGVNALQQRRWTRRKVQEFCAAYEARFGAGGQVPLTYHPLNIIVRRRG